MDTFFRHGQDAQCRGAIDVFYAQSTGREKEIKEKGGVEENRKRGKEREPSASWPRTRMPFSESCPGRGCIFSSWPRTPQWRTFTPAEVQLAHSTDPTNRAAEWSKHYILTYGEDMLI